eukprot:TRINITY_DN6614_c0_g1_i1.p1 TRINITY_DN6614_c0_g1~~TRINITY_DN6614_c0_g1_i1.p1  ORF type:complete len:123 (+),score=29.93 TRINITY_DN6614_c0_g1_i1:246-614(+)
MTAVSSGGGYQSFLGCPSPRGTRELKRSHDDEAYAPTDPFAKLSSSSSSITNVEIEEEAYMSFSGIPNLGVSKKDSTSALGFGVDNVNSVFLLKKYVHCNNKTPLVTTALIALLLLPDVVVV